MPTEDRWLSRLKWAARCALAAGPSATLIHAPTMVIALGWLVTGAVAAALGLWVIRTLNEGAPPQA